MDDVMAIARKNFQAALPAVDLDPGRPRVPLPPPPAAQLSTAELLADGGAAPPAWRPPHELPAVKAAAAALKEAEANLDRVRQELQAARALAAARPATDADLDSYLKTGKVLPKDKDAAAAGDKAARLAELVPRAEDRVKQARAAAAAAWDDAGPTVWREDAEPEHRRVLAALAAALARACLAQLDVRRFEEKFFAFWRANRLADGKVLPPGLHLGGVALDSDVFNCLLSERAPTVSFEVLAAFELLRREGVIAYAPLTEVQRGQLTLAPVAADALLAVRRLLEAVAAGGPTPAQPEPKGD